MSTGVKGDCRCQMYRGPTGKMHLTLFDNLTFVTSCHFLSLAVTLSHYSTSSPQKVSILVTILQKFAKCQQLSLVVTSQTLSVTFCHRLSPSVTFCHLLSLAATFQPTYGGCHVHVLCTPMPQQSIPPWCTMGFLPNLH